MRFITQHEFREALSDISKKDARKATLLNLVTTTIKMSRPIQIMDHTVGFHQHVCEDIANMHLNDVGAERDPKCEIQFFSEQRDLFMVINGVHKRSRKIGTAEQREMRRKIKLDQRRRNASKHTNKLNKALTGFERSVFLDVEWYERSKNKVTEIGYTIVQNRMPVETKHIIIEEHIEVRNGKFVPDNKDNFNFGDSIVLPLEQALEMVRQDLSTCTSIIGHGIGGDITVLSRCLGKQRHGEVFSIFEHLTIIDTVKITVGMSDNGQRMGIKRCLDAFNIDHQHLHNAANDAYYNWMIANEMVTQQQVTQ